MLGSSSAARWMTCVISCSSRTSRERLAVGDVALHERDLGVRRKPEPAVVGAEVEADDLGALRGELGAGPRADAAERAGDEEALAGSRVDVDRDRLGVELDRGATLLVRAEAARLDAAERHVHVGARGLRVDVQEPCLRLVLEARRAGEARREDRRREAELAVVRALASPRRASRSGRATSPARTPPRTRGTPCRRRPRTRSARSGSPRRRRARRRRSRVPPSLFPRSIAAMISSNCFSFTIGPTSTSGSAGSPTLPRSMRASSFSLNASYTSSCT